MSRNNTKQKFSNYSCFLVYMHFAIHRTSVFPIYHWHKKCPRHSCWVENLVWFAKNEMIIAPNRNILLHNFGRPFLFLFFGPENFENVVVLFLIIFSDYFFPIFMFLNATLVFILRKFVFLKITKPFKTNFLLFQTQSDQKNFRKIQK